MKNHQHEVVVFDLDPSSLVKAEPKLAEAIGSGRVTSHSISNYNVNLGGPMIVFVVDDD